MAKINPIPFRIDEMICKQFSASSDKIDGEVVVKSSFTFGVNVSIHHVRCSAIYEYLQNEQSKIKLEMVCSFDVEEKAFNNMLHEHVFTLTASFAQYLATINVGAARGEIHARCENCNSPFVTVILPPINLVETLLHDITFDV